MNQVVPIEHDSKAWHDTRARHVGPVITLTQNFVALIDEVDLPLVADKQWFAARTKSGLVYAHHTAWDGRNVTVRMHRLIARAPDGMPVDHINGCGIDNRRANLRVCSSQNNSWNQKKRAGSSQYRGVTLIRTSGKWRAMIGVNGRLRSIGCYSTEEEAARAYDAIAKIEYGAFARPNFGVGHE